MTILAAGLAIWDLWADAIRTHKEQILSLGAAFAEQTSRTLQAIDLVLDQTKDRVLGSGIASAGRFEQKLSGVKWHHFLADRLKSLPQADALALVDTDGELVNTSRQWPAPATDFADSDFIKHFRLHDDSASFLAAPVKNASSGSWTISVARRLGGPNGEFLGAAVATIRTEDLEAFYKGIALQENGSVMVQRRDGTILARHPHLEKVMGQKMPAESPWYWLAEGGGGTFLSPGYFDGISRFVSVHPLHDYPAVVDVTISESAALANWRREATFIALGARSARPSAFWCCFEP